MNWDAVETTMRKAYRKNRHEIAIPQGRTPLDDLVAKDALPDLAAMTMEQLRECAMERSIVLPLGAERSEVVDVIRDANFANWEERMRGLVAALEYIFADGPHPLALNRRCYSLAKALRPKLIWNMSLADLAVLCDDGKGPRGTDGRATMSARVKRLYEVPIKKAGMRGHKAPFQKDADASRSYSESAKGNQNRRGRDFLALNGKGGGGH